MIPMSCPNCGKQGEVPLDRLNSRLKCKKCGTMFYMDETGSIVLGDPNDPKGRRRKKAESGPAVDLDFGQMIRDIPKPVRIGALALVVVAALGYGVTTLLAALGTPSDVEGRSVHVAELFIDNKLDELQALAKSGTEGDVVKWHEEMRPKLNYEGARKNRRDVGMTGSSMNEESSTAWSFATMVVANAGASPAATSGQDDANAPKNTLSLSLYWAKENGQWVIDGTKTLQEALKPPPPPRRATAGRGR